MKLKQFIFLWLVSLSVLAATLSKSEQEFKRTLNEVRQSFQTKDMSFEVAKLQKLAESEKIDIAKYGLGKGIFKYWLEVTSKISKNKRQNNCLNQKVNHPSQSVEFTTLPRDKNLNYSSYLSESLSVLSLNDAKEVFNILHGYENDLVYSEYGMGCESRAYAMNLIMDEMCINSAKAFIESPKIQLEGHDWSWVYHVAPIILVKDKNKTIPYILDPGIFKTAVPLSTWVEKLREQNQSNNYEVTLTNKYILLPGDKELKHKEYRESDKDEVDDRLLIRSLLRIVRPFIRPLKSH